MGSQKLAVPLLPLCAPTPGVWECTRLPETRGRRPGVEEVAGSCPWWRRAWARKAAGFQPPGAPGISLQTAGMESLARRLTTSGAGAAARNWLIHQKMTFKREFSPVGNVGCAEEDSGPQPGCWRRAWDGRGGVRPLERRRSLRAESLRLRTSGALSSFLKSTCVPPGPFQEVSGPRSPSGALETWPQPWLRLRTPPGL